MPEETKRQKLTEAAKAIKTIANLRQLLGIEEWDYLLIGDGSGTTWERECGWASLLIENRAWVAKAFHGSFSCGTNNIGEIMAYVQPLLWLAERQERKCQPDGSTLVHIVTDSQYVRNTGNLRATQRRGRKHKGLAALWHLLDSLRRSGVILEFHWIPRDLLKANQFSDRLANIAREASKSIDMSPAVQAAGVTTIFELLPPHKERKKKKKQLRTRKKKV